MTKLRIEKQIEGVALITPEGLQMKKCADIPTLESDQTWRATVGSGSHVMLCEEDLRASEIIVEAGGQLDLICLQSAEHPTQHELRKRIIIHEHAAVRVFTALFDSVNVTVEAELRGDHAAYDHQVIYFGSGKQRMRLRLNSNHTGTRTQSRTMIRGVALQNVHVDFSGSIDIAQTGSGTNGRLEHEGLLLSRKARIDSIPGFNINTDDVQAIHSSAVHFVRPEQLFYLQSRGVEYVAAQQMIVTGFLESLLARVHEERMLTSITELIEARKELITQ